MKGAAKLAAKLLAAVGAAWLGATLALLWPTWCVARAEDAEYQR